MNVAHQPTTTPRTRVVLLVMALLSALAVAGCSASGSSSTATGADAAQAQQGRDSSGAGGASSAGSEAGTDNAAPVAGKPGTVGSSVSTVRAATAAQMLARTANLSLKVKDLGEAATRVRAAALAAGGIVTAENLRSTSDAGTGMSGTISIAVPNSRLDDALDKLAVLGKVTDRQVTSEDVASQVVDTQSRIKTQRASVDRVRALMAQATKIEQVVALESELAQREADLEALESGLASLKDRVAMSPIVVSLFTTKAPLAPLAADTGFLTGLRNGWHAFTAATAALLTVLGGVLPFAIFFAVVGYPLWVWSRRRAARRGPRTPAATVTAQP